MFPDEDGEDGAGPTGDYDEDDDEEDEEDEDGSEGGEVGLSFQGKQGNQVGNSGFSWLRHRPASVSHSACVCGQTDNKFLCLLGLQLSISFGYSVNFSDE